MLRSLEQFVHHGATLRVKITPTDPSNRPSEYGVKVDWIVGVLTSLEKKRGRQPLYHKLDAS